jgi:hypothetical protein
MRRLPFLLALQFASGVSAGNEKDKGDIRSLLPDYMTRICLGELKQNRTTAIWNYRRRSIIR